MTAMLRVLASQPHTLTALWMLWALWLTLLPIPVVDPAVSHAFRTVDDSILDWFRWLDDLGDAGTPIIPATLVIIGLLIARHGFAAQLGTAACRRAMGLVWLLTFPIAAIAASGLPCAILKFVVGRTRPKLLDQQELYTLVPFTFDADYFSFPSGHANTAMAYFLAIGLMAPRWKYVFASVGLMIGLFRVPHNAHYLSDIVFGAAIAVFVTLWLGNRFARRGLVLRPEGGLRPLDGPEFIEGWQRLVRRAS